MPAGVSAGAGDVAMQLSQPLQLDRRAVGRGVEFGVELQRGDRRQQPAAGLALVLRTGDVFHQPQQVLRLLQRGPLGRQIGADELAGDQHLGAVDEGFPHLFQGQELARRGGQRHGQGAHDVDLAARVGRTQPPRGAEFGQDALGQRQPHALEGGRFQPPRQPLGRAAQGRDEADDAGVVPGQEFERLGRGQPRQRRQIAAEVEFAAEKVVEAHAGPQDLAQRLFEDKEGEASPRPLGRGRVGQIEQQVDLLGPGLGRGDEVGDARADKILTLWIAAEPLAGGGEVFLGQIGEAALALIGQHPVDGALDHRLEAADHFVDADAARLGLRHGDLLNGVLQVVARRLQLLDQVGAVQQLPRSRSLAHQPVLEQAADPVAGVDVVEVLRADAQRAAVLELDLRLGTLLGPLVEDRNRLVLAVFGVERLLADLHRGELAAFQHLLGGLDGLVAIFHRELQGEGAARPSCEDLEMYLLLVHDPPRGVQLASQALRSR